MSPNKSAWRLPKRRPFLSNFAQVNVGRILFEQKMLCSERHKTRQNLLDNVEIGNLLVGDWESDSKPVFVGVWQGDRKTPPMEIQGALARLAGPPRSP